MLPVCAVFSCVQTRAALPIATSVCRIFLCPNKSSTAHCYQCVPYFPVSKQEQRCPLLPVCAVFSCVQTRAALPIATSVCGIFLCPNKSSAAHCYQCVPYFPVSKQEQCCPLLPVCAVFSCVQTRAALPIATSVCRIFLCPNNQHGDSNPRQCCAACLFSRTLQQHSHPRP